MTNAQIAKELREHALYHHTAARHALLLDEAWCELSDATLSWEDFYTLSNVERRMLILFVAWSLS